MNIGDVVQLLSGGTVMVITSTPDRGFEFGGLEPFVRCEWLDKEQHAQEAWFPEKALASVLARHPYDKGVR